MKAFSWLVMSPLFFKNGEFKGIGGVDVSLEYVDDVVSRVHTFDTGYAFMVSNSGILLSHPVRKDWIGKKSLSDFEDKEIRECFPEYSERSRRTPGDHRSYHRQKCSDVLRACENRKFRIYPCDPKRRNACRSR